MKLRFTSYGRLRFARLPQIRNLVLLFPLFFVSCTIGYDGTERLLVQTKVIDSQGNPIPGVEAEVFSERYDEEREGYYDFPFLSDTDRISFTESDANGLVKMTFPKRFGYTSHTIRFDAPEGYLDFSINGAIESDFIAYKLNVDEVTLYREEETTGLEIELNQQSFAQLVSLYVRQSAETLNMNRLYQTNQFYHDRVPKNSIITLVYTVVSNGLRQTNEVQIAIADQPLTYTLTY